MSRRKAIEVVGQSLRRGLVAHRSSELVFSESRPHLGMHDTRRDDVAAFCQEVSSLGFSRDFLASGRYSVLESFLPSSLSTRVDAAPTRSPLESRFELQGSKTVTHWTGCVHVHSLHRPQAGKEGVLVRSRELHRFAPATLSSHDHQKTLEPWRSEPHSVFVSTISFG